jgi:signal transduction histidine kinase
MTEPLMQTRFAPAERASRAVLERQASYFSQASLPRQLLERVPSLLAILNGQRQIVYANRALLEAIGVDTERDLIGLRPGEALGCLRPAEEVGGCGTGEGCSTCGAVLAILAGLGGHNETRECRITRRSSTGMEALDLRIYVSPLEFSGEEFAVFAASDISDEKRRSALEHIFFHDLLNVVGSIRGFAELLTSYDLEDKEEVFHQIHEAAGQVIDEIQAQRTLLAAENRELRPSFEPVAVNLFLEQIVATCRGQEPARDRVLVLRPLPADALLHSDRALLGRILVNMIKNALEATPRGETVTIAAAREGDAFAFSVHNPGVIPPADRHQIFQRSFSTKGNGRGLGTYSMKLLSGYLQGEISFTSLPREGTTFLGVYPSLQDE